MSDSEKRGRGRPKSLNRDQVIATAMEHYWVDGPANVSINEICKRAGVSKPGLYREFGGEDGLHQAVLENYLDKGLKKLYDVLAVDRPFKDGVEALINLFLESRSVFTSPRGCLLRDMRSCEDHLGPNTCETIERLHSDSMAQYAVWIERAKSRNEIQNIWTDIAVEYVDLQFGNAMLLLKRNEPDDMIVQVMRLAFSVFTPKL
ncbi:TetR family transcriptional regulator [Litorimonas taeanensis]|uniref:TetR family transcriptional regulator n=1 Tax=Litorimonas taeanensis TaxID=568099 RepID=A0A420WJR9_9PROT|nr:TetR/AcrR family transcriptional regulator [Litorimonas taeanensis]RKQ71172.1 TetR family transcriptional regulator [Litorimonas taeanensis]